jgi:hypothetical protein
MSHSPLYFDIARGRGRGGGEEKHAWDSISDDRSKPVKLTRLPGL